MTINPDSINSAIKNLRPSVKAIYEFLISPENEKSKDILKSVIKKFSVDWCSQYIAEMSDILSLPKSERNKQVLGKLFSDNSLTIEMYISFMQVESRKNTPWFMKLPGIKKWAQEFSLNYIGLDAKNCIAEIKKGSFTSEELDLVVFVAGLYLCYQEYTS